MRSLSVSMYYEENDKIDVRLSMGNGIPPAVISTYNSKSGKFTTIYSSIEKIIEMRDKLSAFIDAHTTPKETNEPAVPNAEDSSPL